MAFWRTWFKKEEEAAQAVAELPPRLRPVTIYEFESGSLRGFIQGEGACVGVELAIGSEGRPITAPGGCAMSLAHYACSSFIGPNAALEAEGRSVELSRDAVTVHFPAMDHWPLSAAVCYSLNREGYIDTGFRFEFSEDMPKFEAQVLSPLCEDHILSYVHVEGEWFRPWLREMDMCFFTRDEASSTLVNDGRWDFYIGRGYHVILDERGYDYPLLVHLDERSGWSLVIMMITDECPAISISSQPRQHNFSLIGRNVNAGEVIHCSARLAYGNFRSLEGIIPLYHQFIRDARDGNIPMPE